MNEKANLRFNIQKKHLLYPIAEMKRETKESIYLAMIIIGTIAMVLLVLSELGVIG